jgi:hypothetical protein
VRRYSIVVALLFAVACASGSQAAAPATVAPSAHDNGSGGASDAAHLTQEQITAANLPTAYDLVDRLRRPWLRRDAVTGGEVVVYMDERNIGAATALRDVPSVDVAAMDYISNADATKRWGADIKGSVILVVRRR